MAAPRRRTGRTALAAAIAAAGVLGAGAATPAARAAARAGRPSSAATCPVVAGARPAPSARAVLGHALDSAPLSPEEADAYLVALDRASPRILTRVAGRTSAGRPLRYAVVGDPGALAPTRLAALSRDARAVRAGTASAAVLARAARRPALVWLGAGVHGNEPSGTTAALVVLARLAGSDDCADRRILRGTVAVVVPDQNPDGRALDTRTNAADVDLNRDWFAASQPETRARLATLTRFPPVVAVDAHEQTGSDYFVPPYDRPTAVGLPHAARRFADAVVAPAVGRALDRTGAPPRHGGYDLLYPGYADSATSLLFGAGGMTFEQGSDPPPATKAARHATALRATLAAVAADAPRAVRAWAAGFADATAAGRAGRGARGDRVHGWVLRTDAHAADATALAESLRTDGVRVQALRRPVRTSVDALGPAGPRTTLLPAGTLVVPAAQPLGHWADTLLGRDADEAGDAAAGSDTWSVPRLAGIDAGVLRSAVPARALRPFSAPPAATVPAGGTVAFAADSAVAVRLATAALVAGRPVARAADGTLRTTAPPGWAAAAARAGLTVRPAAGAPVDGARALSAPRVAVLPDATPLMQGPPATLPVRDRPAGWLVGALRQAGAAPTALVPAALGAGVPPGVTHLVVGPGTLPTLADAGRAAVAAWVRAGGTLVAVGEAGTAAAVGLGLSAVTSEAGSPAAVSVAVAAGTDPVGRDLDPTGSVVVAGEPRLHAPAGATVPLRARSGAALAPSGAPGAGAGLAGRPLVVDEAVGAGHVLTLGFSPAFRRQGAGGERVLLELLLAPR